MRIRFTLVPAEYHLFPSSRPLFQNVFDSSRRMAVSRKTTGALGSYFAPAGAPPASGWDHPALAQLGEDCVVRDRLAPHDYFPSGNLNVQMLPVCSVKLNTNLSRATERPRAGMSESKRRGS